MAEMLIEENPEQCMDDAINVIDLPALTGPGLKLVYAALLAALAAFVLVLLAEIAWARGASRKIRSA